LSKTTQLYPYNDRQEEKSKDNSDGFCDCGAKPLAQNDRQGQGVRAKGKKQKAF
jgi:hypothetical protein